jgi:hypothetical protein
MPILEEPMTLSALDNIKWMRRGEMERGRISLSLVFCFFRIWNELAS